MTEELQAWAVRYREKATNAATASERIIPTRRAELLERTLARIADLESQVSEWRERLAQQQRADKDLINAQGRMLDAARMIAYDALATLELEHKDAKLQELLEALSSIDTG